MIALHCCRPVFVVGLLVVLALTVGRVASTATTGDVTIAVLQE